MSLCGSTSGTRTLCVRVCPSISPPPSLSLSLSPCLPVSVSISLSLSLCVCLCVCVYLSLPVPPGMSLGVLELHDKVRQAQHLFSCTPTDSTPTLDVDVCVEGKAGVGKTSTVLSLCSLGGVVNPRGLVGLGVWHTLCDSAAGSGGERERVVVRLRFYDAPSVVRQRFEYVRRQMPRRPHLRLKVFSCGDKDSLASLEETVGHARTCACTHTHTHTHFYTYSHKQTYTQVHTCTHTHTHTEREREEESSKEKERGWNLLEKTVAMGGGTGEWM